MFEAVRAGEDEVLDVVRGLHRGESRLTPLIARKMLDKLQQLAQAADPHPTPLQFPSANHSDVALNDKEENVLRLIVAGKTNRQIAEAVFLAEGTVKNDVSRIMKKLHAATRTELAVMALRQRR